MKLPQDENLLWDFVEEKRAELMELEQRVRSGEKSYFRALKIARKDYNAILKKLRHQLRHVRDDERRELLENILLRAP